MIKDEKEYEYSKECASKFAHSIDIIENDEVWKQRDPEDLQLDIDVKRSHLTALQQEITEYERLINCNASKSIQIQVESFNKLPDVLIKARIAAKITQKELAEVLGIEEQRVKECEDTDYQCASFIEILEVSAALGVEFRNSEVEVNFEEIEDFKKTALKFHKWQQQKEIIQSQAS